MPVYHVTSLAQTEGIAQALAPTLSQGAIVAFFGNLGTGKTSFIRALGTTLGIDEKSICSPTFQYLNIYDSAPQLYHFDLYRLKNEEEFIEMGFDEFFQIDGIVCIEWAERIEKIIPKKAIQIHLEHTKSETRRIEIKGL